MTGRRLFLSLLALVTVGALSSFITVAVIVVKGATPPPPPLLEHLEGSTWEEKGDSFTRRLHANFPIGSNEDALIAELQRQGFKPGWPSAGSTQRSASFSTGYLACNYLSWVTWRSTPEGKVLTLTGRTGAICL